MAKVTVYTDGGASGNPNRGWGAVLISGKHIKEMNGGFRLTTNNRMELLAVIKALEAMKNPGTEVTIYSDSKYVVDAVSKKVGIWMGKEGFKGKKNPDLWNRFLKIYAVHKVDFCVGYTTQEMN